MRIYQLLTDYHILLAFTINGTFSIFSFFRFIEEIQLLFEYMETENPDFPLYLRQ